MSTSLLSNIYLFDQFTEEELHRIAAVSKEERYSAGEHLFDQGDEAHSLYVIKYGSVQLQQNVSPDSATMVVSTLGSGAHFGEMSLIDDDKRSTTAIAMEKSEIVVIEYDTLLKVLDETPTLAAKFYRALAHYLSGRLRRTTADLGYSRERNLHHG